MALTKGENDRLTGVETIVRDIRDAVTGPVDEPNNPGILGQLRILSSHYDKLIVRCKRIEYVQFGIIGVIVLTYVLNLDMATTVVLLINKLVR